MKFGLLAVKSSHATPLTSSGHSIKTRAIGADIDGARSVWYLYQSILSFQWPELPLGRHDNIGHYEHTTL